MKLFEPLLFGDRPVQTLLGASDPKRVLAAHVGHFALHERSSEGDHLLARDLLGVHKLFFTVADGTVETSNYLIELLRAGHSLEDVFSVPAGHYLRLNPGEQRYELVRWGQVRFGAETSGPHPEQALAQHAALIRAKLEQTFRMLAKRCAGRPVYVTLSGGLDSTTIAVLAREYCEHVRAVTFALQDPREAGPGADLFFARRVASDLGIELVEVLARPDEVIDLLDEVLVYGQDYRDFNVHCGLVNAAIGKAIGALHSEGPRPVVLTGDAMNELLADYAPVQFQGREYCKLPMLERSLIRRFLVAGLDSCDREVGIFARFGVEAVEPYAVCAQEYAALPTDLACGVGSKARLVHAVMDGRIPDYVLERPKVRAQVAVEGEPGGTFALLVSRGIDQEHLKSRFAGLLAIDPLGLNDLTRAGYYRFSTSLPERFARAREHRGSSLAYAAVPTTRRVHNWAST